MNSSFPTEMYIFLPRSWRYAKNGAETPDGAILGIFYVENRFQRLILYRKSHDNRWSEQSDGMSGDPNLHLSPLITALNLNFLLQMCSKLFLLNRST